MPHPTTPSRKRRSPAQWAELFARFEHSALSVAAFCARESISVANFYRQRELQKVAACAKPSSECAPDAAGFLDLGPLTTTGAPERARLELKIDLGEGLILHLVRG